MTLFSVLLELVALATYTVHSYYVELEIIRIQNPERNPAEMWKQLIVFATVAVVVASHHERNQPFRAVVRLASPVGQEITGNITFTELPEGKVHVEGTIFGLARGEYGFHVHEKGDITGGCLSTGAHFNPEHKEHGHPNDENRHVGDLGNVVFDDSRVSHLDFFDSKIALSGPNCILGRAVVLHEKEDDFGRGGHPDSRKTGNAGGRVACGVIGILDPVTWYSTDAASTFTVTSAFVLTVTQLLIMLK